MSQVQPASKNELPVIAPAAEPRPGSGGSGPGQAEPVVEVETFSDIYYRGYPSLVRLGILLLGDRGQAEEVVQDAFVIAYERWSRIDTPSAYVRQIVVNRSRDVLRRRQVAEALHLRRTAPDAVDPREHIDDLLATLPSHQRMAVVLRFYEDLTVDQIAEVLSTRPGTVKSWLHRAMIQLRKDLEP